MSLLLLFSGLELEPIPPTAESRTATAQLLDSNGTLVAGDPLARAFDLTFMDELSGSGSGTMSLPLSEVGAGELTPGRFIQIMVGGVVRFTFMIEGDPQLDVITLEEELTQIVTVTGRGWGCVLDTAVVYPDADFDLRLDTSWRVFSFASPDFPAANQASWANAVELYEYLDGVTYGERYQISGVDDEPYPSPIGFPWPTQGAGQILYDPGPPREWTPGVGYQPTYWIWTEQGDSTEEFAIGFGFFRTTLTLDEPTVVEFNITGDNAFILFVEGIPVVGENDDIWVWTGWKDATVNFPQGEFTIGVVVENLSHSLPGEGVNQNSAGMILAAFTRGAGQVPETVYLVSDDTWVCEFSADDWPGWTAGQIVDKITDEAQGRGALAQYVGATFSDLFDSNGDAWVSSDPDSPSGYIPAFASQVGSTIMATLAALNEQGWVDWHVQPTNLRLDMYSASLDHGGSGVVFAAGVNITSLQRSSTALYANALIIQWDQGYALVPAEDAVAGEFIDEIAAFGNRVEDIWSTDAVSKEDAERQGRIELRKRRTEGWPAIVMGIEPVDASDAPYTGFGLGQTVTIPAVGGGTEQVKVLSISMKTDKEGYVEWIVELNRRMRNPIRVTNDLLRTIGGRSGSTSGGIVY